MRDELERALALPELVLRVPGRRTGTSREVTLWFAHEDGVLWLRTDRDMGWYRNLVAAGRCRIRVGAFEVEGVLEPVEDEAAALRHLVALWRAKYGVEYVADWYVDRGRVPVRIRIVPDGARGT
jgi:deazaflavin-dependent oxidoreductase (nitroreductase family)